MAETVGYLSFVPSVEMRSMGCGALREKKETQQEFHIGGCDADRDRVAVSSKQWARGEYCISETTEPSGRLGGEG